MSADAFRLSCVVYHTDADRAPSLHRQHLLQVLYKMNEILAETKRKATKFREETQFGAPCAPETDISNKFKTLGAYSSSVRSGNRKVSNKEREPCAVADAAPDTVRSPRTRRTRRARLTPQDLPTSSSFGDKLIGPLRQTDRTNSRPSHIYYFPRWSLD